MKFRTVNKALNKLLGDSADGRYQTVGYETQGLDSSEFKDNKRIVQCYYSHGEFPRSGGSLSGPKKHDIHYSLGLYVSAAARVDLSAINREGATRKEVSDALSALQDGAYVADTEFDEFVEILFGVMTDGLNRDIGLPRGTVSNCWINSIRKDDPLPRGSLVVLTGEINFTLSVSEDITGDIPVPLTTGVFGGPATPLDPVPVADGAAFQIDLGYFCDDLASTSTLDAESFVTALPAADLVTDSLLDTEEPTGDLPTDDLASDSTLDISD